MPFLPSSLVADLCAWADGSEAHRARPDSWSRDKVLTRLATPAAAALAVRCHPLGDAVLRALAHRHEDPVATMAALAGLAPRLNTIVGRWRRAGMPAQDLIDAEADLVAEALHVLRHHPDLPSDLVVRSAWHRTHGRRRTERSRSARIRALDAGTTPSSEMEAHPLAGIIGCLSAAMSTATLRRDEASAIWADVCGWTPSEAASLTGWSGQTWRARRLRAFAAARHSPAFKRLEVA